MKLSNITKFAKMTFVTLMSVSLVGVMGIFPATADAASSLQKIGSVSDVSLDAAFGVATDTTNDRAIVVSINGSLAIVDLTNVENPTIIGSVSAPSLKGATDVELDATKKFAYVTVQDNSNSGLVTVDLSDPTIPVIGQVLNQAGAIPLIKSEGIDRDGDSIYVATQTGVYVFDITTPATPTHIRSYQFDPSGYRAGNVGAWSIDVEGSYAYVVTNNTDRFYAIPLSITGGIIYSPANGCGNPGDSCLWPTTREFEGAVGVVVKGDYAYVTSYVANRLVVVDISDPTTPVVVTTLKAVDSDAFNGPAGIAVGGNRLAVTSMNTGSVALVDISNPLVPTVISTYEGGSSGTHLEFYDNKIITLDRIADDLSVLKMVSDDVPVSSTVTNTNGNGGSSSVIRGLLARSSAQPRSGVRQRVDGGLLCPVNLNVSLGSVNEDVTRVKAIVAFTGDFTGDIRNNVYDQATADAVLKFQQRRHLKLQDGIVGVETQAAMAPICRGEETGATTPVVDLSA